MNPIWTAAVRNYWPLIGAFGICLILTVSDQIWFRPAADRYAATMKRASELGLVLDPNDLPPVLPPRLFALLSDNALPAAEAQEQGNSGALTAQLLEDLTEMASRHGMRVIVTEPGPMSSLPKAMVVRAHIKVRCSYAQLVLLLDDIAHGQKLLTVERFLLNTDAAGHDNLELWVSRYIIMQEKTRR